METANLDLGDSVHETYFHEGYVEDSSGIASYVHVNKASPHESIKKEIEDEDCRIENYLEQTEKAIEDSKPFIVQKDVKDNMDITKENSVIFAEKLETIVKTYAQRQKEYRERKKIAKQQLQGAKKIPKTNAQRQQKFRQNQKKLQQSEALNLASPIQMEVIADVYQEQSQRNIQSTQTRPSNADRQTRYREKRKADKMNVCTAFSQSSDVQPQQEQPQHDVQINKRQPQSNAERQRKYRKLLREQLHQQQQIEDMNAITVLNNTLLTSSIHHLQNVDQAAHARKRYLNKQRQSRFRARQRLESASTSSHQAQAERKKLNAERSKRYRDKLKLKKQRAELESLLSTNKELVPTVLTENKKETHRYGTNCEELIHSQCQIQTNQIQPALNLEAQQVISPSFQSLEAPYEERDGCSIPNALLHHETEIAGGAQNFGASDPAESESLNNYVKQEKDEIADEERKYIIDQITDEDSKFWSEEDFLTTCYPGIIKEEKNEDKSEKYDFVDVNPKLDIKEEPEDSEDVTQFKCTLCSFSTPLQFCLEGHMKVDHSKTITLKCELCEFSTITKANLRTHLSDVHLRLKGNNCDYCDYSTSRTENLRRHVITVHLQLRKRKCQFCDYSTAQRIALEDHVNSVHLNLKDQRCDMCEFRTSTKRNLKKHVVAVHLRLKNHKCDQCDYTSNQVSNLRRHVEYVHLQPRDRCSYCDFASTSKLELKRHLSLKHSYHSTFRCDLCDYSSGQKQNLKIHIKAVHFQVKNYKCDSCDYTSARNTDLKKHVNNVHLKLKNFNCEYCEYTSNSRTYIRQHTEAVHLKLKSFKCDACDYSTPRRDSLKLHVNTRHLHLKEHKCNYCEYAGSTKRDLKLHLSKNHFEERVDGRKQLVDFVSNETDANESP